MQFKIIDGSQATPLLEPHYHMNGSPNFKARESDLFFVALNLGNKVLGSVRFCIEENTPLLRTMTIAEQARRTGIGSNLLNVFQDYLDKNSIRETHLVCGAHLHHFYGKIGFEPIAFTEAPTFLQDRMKQYDPELKRMTCMRRP